MTLYISDWKGQIFNGCEILEPKEITRLSCADKWKIHCHCGEYFYARPYDLKIGKIKSHGCDKQKRMQLLGKSSKSKKYNYFDYINEHGVKILYPVDSLRVHAIDDWICLCPHHDPPREFIATAQSIIYGRLCCGCITRKKSSERMKLYNQQQRLDKGLDQDKSLFQEGLLLRTMLCNKAIRHLIYSIDKRCKICNGKSECIHHIVPVNNIMYSDKQSFLLMYDLNNLVALCNECHDLAHGYNTRYIDPIIQQLLKDLIKKRNISEDIQHKYQEIVNTQIIPWLNAYLQS